MTPSKDMEINSLLMFNSTFCTNRLYHAMLSIGMLSRAVDKHIITQTKDTFFKAADCVASQRSSR